MTTDAPIPHRDFDGFWKLALTWFLEDFLRLAAPEVHAAIDWTHEPTSLEQELQSLFPAENPGARRVDKLFQVRMKSGGLQLIHVEVQGEPEPGFPRRMYVYRYRSSDRYPLPIVSLAVLADDDPRWRPGSYQEDAGGSRLRLDYPLVKLLDHPIAELERDENPFALLVLAHRYARATRADRRRLYFKQHLLELLLSRRYDRWRTVRIFRLFDWLMVLPAELQEEFKREKQRMEKQADLPYLSSFEIEAREEGLAEGLEKGLEKGLQEGLEKGLEKGLQEGLQEGRPQGKASAILVFLECRFGVLGDSLRARVSDLRDPDALDRLARAAALAPSLAGFESALNAERPGA